MPAIKPIREDKLKRNIRALSGFGMRMHPIFKRKKMHTGMDFTCPRGTDIQATGAGTIHKIIKKKAPHLHYEVIHNGKKVNPINYCMDGLSAEEYQALVEAAYKINQSFD